MPSKTKAELGIDINVQTAKASKKVQKFSKNGKKSFDAMGKSAKQFSLALKGAIAIFAGRKLLGAFNEVIDAANAQEDAINSLNTQLKLAGDYSEETSQDMQDFASSLQEVSTQGDETTLELLALAKTFDTTNEGAKALTLASTELAAATGQDTVAAMRQLGKTLGGTTGRIAEAVPAIKELSAEQLKAGEGIKLVLDRFGGTATGKIATFSGATTQLKNSFGDLLEEIGFSVTKSDDLINVIDGFKNIVGVFSSFIKNQDLDIGAILAGGLTGLLKISVHVFKNISKTLSVLTHLGLEAAKGFSLMAKAVLSIGESETGLEILRTSFSSLLDLTGAFIAGLSVIGDALGLDSSALEEAAMKMASLSLEAENLDGEGLKKLNAGLDESIKDLDQMQVAVAETDLSFQGLGDSITTAFDKGSTAIKKTSADLAKGLDGPQTKLEVESETQIIDKKAFDGLGKGLLSSLSSASKKAGKEGGEEFGKAAVNKAGSAVAESLLPGFGGEIFNIFSNLSLMSDEEIGQFTQGIVDGAVMMVEVLAEKADVIVLALVDALITNGGLVRIAVALGKAFIEVVKVGFGLIFAGVKTFFENIGNSVFEGAKQFLAGIFSSITNAFQPLLNIGSTIFRAFIDGAQAVYDSISDALSIDIGGGGSGGLLGGSVIPGLLNKGGIVGLANGGSVPGAGNSDSQMTILTPGEIVIPKPATNDFSNVVADIAKQAVGSISNGAGQTQTVINQIVLNGEVLAEQILELNQDNARLA